MTALEKGAAFVLAVWIVGGLWLWIAARRVPRTMDGKTVWEVLRRPSRAAVIGTAVRDLAIVGGVWAVYFFGWLPMPLEVAIAVTGVGIFWWAVSALGMYKMNRLPHGPAAAN